MKTRYNRDSLEEINYSDYAISLIEKYDLDRYEAYKINKDIENIEFHIARFNDGQYESGDYSPFWNPETNISDNLKNALDEEYEHYKEYLDYFLTDYYAVYFTLHLKLIREQFRELKRCEQLYKNMAQGNVIMANEFKDELLAKIQNMSNNDKKGKTKKLRRQ